MRKRNDGRRATDTELARLRRLEVCIRNFIAHYQDHPAERFAPRTRQLVEESQPIFDELDKARVAVRRPVRTTEASSEVSETPEAA